jgi:hypothetical protein
MRRFPERESEEETPPEDGARTTSEDQEEIPPEDRPGEPGAEGGSKSPAADKPPAVPAEDDSPLGDTDQHSQG